MNMISRTFSQIKSLFFHGLFTLFPITVTIVILHFSYTLVAKWIAPIKAIIPAPLHTIPGAEFVMVLLSIFIIGAILKFLLLGPVVHQAEKLIKKIPLVRIIYSSSKILVDFFNVPNPATVEKKVVLVEFPRKGTYNIAFLLESAQNNFQRLLPDGGKKGKEYYKVFMPNSPNPTSGYFMILPKEEVIDTDISFEDAIKTIVSCGIHTPEHMGKRNSRPPKAPESALEPFDRDDEA